MRMLKKEAIQKAVKLHGPITPCAGRQTLSDCFTIEINGLYLWFNCKDNSTRVIRNPLQKEKHNSLAS
ncbi:MAG: hypothetical protein GF401_03865 [Chitinivibrionales bacterium]|nr:hypothetical protein [Chitinivibrionales bacterium]